MTFDELKNHLQTAAENGTLLTPKHDPGNLSTTYSKYRTVIAGDLANNLAAFIKSGEFTVREFENRNFPNSPLYFEITPSLNSGFNVPASGVTANSIFANSVVDKLVVISGGTIGWHIFGEDSAVIQTKETNGDLLFKNNL